MNWVLRHFAALAVLVSVFVAQVAVADERQTSTEPAVLYWMVEDPLVDDNGTMRYIDVLYSRPGGKQVTDARVHVTGDGVAADTYLTLLNMDYSESAATGLDLTPLTAEGVYAGPAMSPLSAEWSGATFTMELGYYDDKGNWMVMAKSAGETWDSLTGYMSFDDIDPAHMHWAPTAFVVPEPSSGLLILIGSALLALRRKRENAIA